MKIKKEKKSIVKNQTENQLKHPSIFCLNTDPKKNLLIILGIFFILIILFFFDNFNREGKSEKAYFAGGCFWCIEAPFQESGGVSEAISGYIGGSEENANYRAVSGGETKHLESVEVIYDNKKISYKELLKIFFSQIDPTDTEGQFVDRGLQYTTAIFYVNGKQKKEAEDFIKNLDDSKKFDKKIVVKVLPLEKFFIAEEYHQDFYKKSAQYYEAYKKGSGRSDFIDNNWAKEFILEKIEKKDWKNFEKPADDLLEKKLTKLEYFVTQKKGTERSYKNEYWDNKKEGIYVDKISGEPLFSSTDKYDSKTGWPSFTKSLSDEKLIKNIDYKLGYERVEIESKLAKTHLGHIFNDGPRDRGGLRYCINSASLNFVKKEDLEKKGYEDFLYLFDLNKSAGIHYTWDINQDGLNDCEVDGSCDHTVDYSLPRYKIPGVEEGIVFDKRSSKWVDKTGICNTCTAENGFGKNGELIK